MIGRHTRTALTITGLIVLLVVGVVVGWRTLTAPIEDGTPTAQGPTPSCDTGLSKGDRVRSSQATVSIYNAGTRPGLAAETLDALVDRGFLAGDIGNAPDRYSEVRFVRVLAPTSTDPAARLVALQFGARTYIEATRADLGPGVDVIVGNDFRGLVKASRSLVAQRAGSGC